MNNINEAIEKMTEYENMLGKLTEGQQSLIRQYLSKLGSLISLCKDGDELAWQQVRYYLNQCYIVVSSIKEVSSNRI